MPTERKISNAYMGSGHTSTEKLAAITLGLLAVISPLYIDRKPSVEPEDEAGIGSLASWLPLVLLILIVATISLTCFLDRRFSKFDPYWIHRVGGSSCGLVMLLMILGLVLKCKASLGN